MNKHYCNYTIEEFTNKLAGADATPGGGTVAALAGMAGVALIEMVVRLSLGRPEFVQHSALFEDSLRELAQIRARFAMLMDSDAAAFDAVMAAFRMPKCTDEDKRVRAQAIQAAYITAAAEPVATIQQASAALVIAAALLGTTNSNAASDLWVGADMCHTALKSALANVAINLPAIKCAATAAQLREQACAARAAATTAYRASCAHYDAAASFALLQELFDAYLR